jgi:hypothetical protein
MVAEAMLIRLLSPRLEAFPPSVKPNLNAKIWTQGGSGSSTTDVQTSPGPSTVDSEASPIKVVRTEMNLAALIKASCRLARYAWVLSWFHVTG